MKETNPGYQTGPTKPPKRYQALLAILLVLVIFLGGLSTALGVLNIRLFRLLSSEEGSAAPIRFSQDSPDCGEGDPADTHYNALGLATQTVTPFLQSYYSLPEGVYITAVAEGSAAQAAGLYTGDIILAVENVPTPDQQTLQNLLNTLPQGKEVVLTVYQDEQQKTLNLIKE